MAGYPKALTQCIDQLKQLPGIGERTAERLAMHILKQQPDYATTLSNSIGDMRNSVHYCKRCFNVTDKELCHICEDNERDHSLICVVETPRDINLLEERGVYRGAYHCLLGRLAPAEGISEDQLTLKALARRLRDSSSVSEVIIATHPDLAGDATALAVARVISNTDVIVTRLARGVPVGYSLDALSAPVLEEAIAGRQPLVTEGGGA